jgi:hypothetical protein
MLPNHKENTLTAFPIRPNVSHRRAVGSSALEQPEGSECETTNQNSSQTQCPTRDSEPPLSFKVLDSAGRRGFANEKDARHPSARMVVAVRTGNIDFIRSWRFQYPTTIRAQKRCRGRSKPDGVMPADLTKGSMPRRPRLFRPSRCNPLQVPFASPTLSPSPPAWRGFRRRGE